MASVGPSSLREFAVRLMVRAMTKSYNHRHIPLVMSCSIYFPSNLETIFPIFHSCELYFSTGLLAPISSVLYLFSFYKLPGEIDTFLSSIVLMKKLRHRKINTLPEDTGLVRNS